MRCIKLLSICMLLFGFMQFGSAQTLQEVNDALKKGSELKATGDLDGAIAELEKCVDLSTEVGDDALEFQVVAEKALPELYLAKAQKIYATKDFPEYLKALETTVAVSEKYQNTDIKEKAEKVIPQAYFAIGAAEYQEKKYDDALKTLGQAVALDPNFARPYYILGVIYQTMKDEDKMAENYKTAIEAGEANNDATTAKNAKTQWFNYYNVPGTQAFNAQKWDDAISLLTKAVEIDDTKDNAFYALATCYNNKKNWDLAISNAEKTLELRSGGDTNDAYYQLGVAFAGKNDKAKACETFKKVTGGRYLESADYQIKVALKCQ